LLSAILLYNLDSLNENRFEMMDGATAFLEKTLAPT
jgi:hypothetical protein